jgi:hypothetical protein
MDNLVELTCTFCKKKFYRMNGRVNEAKRAGWLPYCALACQYQARIKKKQLLCAHPECRKSFLRAPHEIRSRLLFCSRSCAASINNSNLPKRKAAVFKCLRCHKKSKGRGIYCSKECKNQSQTIERKEILKGIQKFYYRVRTDTDESGVLTLWRCSR